METKEVKIEVPKGYEIDKENSTFECIKFKPIKKAMTYEDVARELFKDKNRYITTFSCLKGGKDVTCTSSKQAEKLIAINKLMNVAKYLKNKNKGDKNYFIYIGENGELDFAWGDSSVERMIYFDCRDSAIEAIEILGEQTIKTALSTDW